MKAADVVIGLTAVVHPNMPGDDRGVYKRVIDGLEKLKGGMGFELRVIPKPLESEEDGRRARAFMDENGVDLTLIFNASLGYGRVVLPLARVRSHLGLWSVPEPTKDGVLQLNSFCGLNMYGAIIANYLSEYSIPFKWFYGFSESELFLERFKITLKAMRALKTLKNSRIGLIGGIADGFENLNFDERVLEKTFGTYLQTRHSVEDIVARAKSYESGAVETMLKTISSEGDWNRDRVSTVEMEKFARVNLAFEDFAREHGYNALCISCWPKFQEVYDLAVCGAMSRLNENGIVAPCEGDVPGAINMLILNALADEKATLCDLVSLDEEDSSINMWHCGVAPGSLTCEGCVRWDAHFNIGEYKGEEWHGRGVVADFTFKPGEVTITRIDNTFENLLVMTGNVIEGKKSYYGASGWVHNVKMEDSVLSIPDLINTIVVNRIDHHYPMVYGNVRNELYEFASWKGIDVVKPAFYKPYMQNKP